VENICETGIGWSKKADTRFIFAITLSILDRFAKFFQKRRKKKNKNKKSQLQNIMSASATQGGHKEETTGRKYPWRGHNKPIVTNGRS